MRLACYPETNVHVPLDSTADVPSDTRTSESVIVRLQRRAA